MDINKDNRVEDKNLNIASDKKSSWVHLTTADNEFEYNIIKGKLTENKIVCIGKGQDMDLLDSGFLNIILGPCIPVEIMVPQDMYDEALQIINLKISDEELEELAINSEQEDKVERNYKK